VAAFDVDVEGDGVASTWIVGPEGEIPHEARSAAPPAPRDSAIGSEASRAGERVTGIEPA
jgi:hypothetical protein